MTNGAPASVLWRGGSILLLCLALLAGSGCVYLRLFQLRRQLASFDDYCTFRQEPGPVIAFTEPILYPRDITWLLNLPVSEIRSDAAGRSLHVFRFHECPDQRPDLSQTGSLEVILVEAGGRVAEIRLPERLNPLIDRERLRRAFLGADQARLDRSEGKTSWVLDDRLAFPLLDDLTKGLGLPCTRESQGRYHVLVYEYALDRPEKGVSTAEPPDAQGVFVYDSLRERIRGSWIKVGCLAVEVAGAPGESYQVDIRRSPD
jgi:hypothetical protein